MAYKSQDSCTKHGVFEERQLTSFIKVYLRQTLVAMATKVWKFNTITYNLNQIRNIVHNLAPNGGF